MPDALDPNFAERLLAALRTAVVFDPARAVAERVAFKPRDFNPVAAERSVIERLVLGRFAVECLVALRLAVLRFTVPRLEVLRVPRRDGSDDGSDSPSSFVHLPDITRLAASATASAINDPNLVALETMLAAACEAVSAASRPASRIARRALGLALIAAAAAAKPAASISLLIAVFASLSTVSDELDEERLEVRLAGLANSPPLPSKDDHRQIIRKEK